MSLGTEYGVASVDWWLHKRTEIETESPRLMGGRYEKGKLPRMMDGLESGGERGRERETRKDKRQVGRWTGFSLCIIGSIIIHGQV